MGHVGKLMRFGGGLLLLLLMLAPGQYVGRWVFGSGDAGYLRALDWAAQMVAGGGDWPDLSLLHEPQWDGLRESPGKWRGWWTQNALGPTYCLLLFADDETFRRIGNSQALWWRFVGDGRRADLRGTVAPDGCLCDAVIMEHGRLEVIYKQGDIAPELADWPLAFTLAGVVQQAELLLISRDNAEIAKYLPLIERALAFVDRRRDKRAGLIWAGPASNLLAPSYNGDRGRPAPLAELSILYLVALDRAAELELLGGQSARAQGYRETAALVRAGLPALTGAGKSGRSFGRYIPAGGRALPYYEAGVNEDAIGFGVVGRGWGRAILADMEGVPALRERGWTRANAPGYADDMPINPTSSLAQFGVWVNGGVWPSHQARMILAYMRAGRCEDAAAAVGQEMEFIRTGRLAEPFPGAGIAPLAERSEGEAIWYDFWGPPAALLRGTVWPEYRADTLTLTPYLPPSVSRLELRIPIRWGAKRVHVTITERRRTMTLHYDSLAAVTKVDL